MQKLGDTTSNLIPKPKLNVEVQDSVSNENRSLFQAKAIWIRDAKRFIIKESKNPFHNSEYASLAFVQRVIDNAVNYDLIMQNTFEYTENQCIFVSKLVHLPTQEMEISKIPMLLTKNDPQALSSAITYYRRLICATMLDIVTVDTNDEKSFLITYSMMMMMVTQQWTMKMRMAPKEPHQNLILKSPQKLRDQVKIKNFPNLKLNLRRLNGWPIDAEP